MRYFNIRFNLPHQIQDFLLRSFRFSNQKHFYLRHSRSHVNVENPKRPVTLNRVWETKAKSQLKFPGIIRMSLSDRGWKVVGWKETVKCENQIYIYQSRLHGRPRCVRATTLRDILGGMIQVIQLADERPCFRPRFSPRKPCNVTCCRHDPRGAHPQLNLFFLSWNSRESIEDQKGRARFKIIILHKY